MAESVKKQDSQDEILQAIQALTKVVTLRQSKGNQRRFPFLCRNGASCPWKACGACWFKHQDEDQQQPPQQNEIATFNVISMESKVADITKNIDKKLSELSKYVDRCLGEMESKLQTLAETFFKHEDELHEMTAASHSATDYSQSFKAALKAELEDSWGEKLDSKLDKAKLETNALFEATFTVLVEKTGNRIKELELSIASCTAHLQSEPPSEPRATGG